MDETLTATISDALAASGVVGFWDWDHVRHEAIYDAGAAKLLAGDADLAGQRLTRSQATACIHPDDRHSLIANTIRLAERGGLYVSEYRVVSRDGETRWLFSRGRTTLDAGGSPLRGQGILIDITETRDHQESYVALMELASDPLQIAADHIIAARKALPDAGSFRMRTALDIALTEIAAQLARKARRPIIGR